MEQLNLLDYAKEIRFNGDVYEPERDDVRLTGQILRVFNTMRDNGGWMTCDEISEITGDPITSISAQIRHLRKERFGKHETPKRRRDGSNLWEFKLFINEGE